MKDDEYMYLLERGAEGGYIVQARVGRAWISVYAATSRSDCLAYIDDKFTRLEAALAEAEK